MINKINYTQGNIQTGNLQPSDGKKAAEAPDFSALITQYREKLAERIRNNDTEPKFQIGSAEYSVKEWDKLMARIDAAEETVKEELKEREERLSEEEMREAIQKLLEDRDL